LFIISSTLLVDNRKILKKAVKRTFWSATINSDRS